MKKMLIDSFSYLNALFAASIFSLIPPTGKTLPLSVISPDIAKFLATFFLLNKDARDVNMVISEIKEISVSLFINCSSGKMTIHLSTC